MQTDKYLKVYAVIYCVPHPHPVFQPPGQTMGSPHTEVHTPTWIEKETRSVMSAVEMKGRTGM